MHTCKQIPAEVRKVCKRLVGESLGWSWDPFQSVLRNEYYDCTEVHERACICVFYLCMYTNTRMKPVLFAINIYNCAQVSIYIYVCVCVCVCMHAYVYVYVCDID